jgi:hypothetical protein
MPAYGDDPPWPGWRVRRLRLSWLRVALVVGGFEAAGVTVKRALLVLVLLPIAACSSGGSKPSSSVTSSPSVVSAPTSLSTQAQLQAWWKGGAEADVTQIGTDLQRVQDAGVDPANTAELAAACISLKSDLESAGSRGAPPVAEAAGPWDTAIATYRQAATECAEGAQSPPDAALLGRMVDDIGAGNTALEQATRAIQAFGS